MNQVLWIGSIDSIEEFKVKAKKGSKSASAQVSQMNLIDGIESVTWRTMDTVNGSVLPHYPLYEDKTINEVVWSRVKDSQDISVGYKNYKYLNRLTCRVSMEKAVDEWINLRYLGGELTVFVYNIRSAPMVTAWRLKKKIPNAKLYLVVPDLPQFMDLGQSHVKAFLKKIDEIIIRRMLKKMDGFILYAARMAEYLKIPKDKWILMEGSIRTEEIPDSEVYTKAKAIMYSGQLDIQYGIDLLLDAFMTVKDPELELWISGGGNAEELICKCAEQDSRIRYFGFLPTRADVLKKQQEASVLINMRLPSEAASAYCFPSKLFEYLSSGKPVLSFEIDGIPKEYYNYLVKIEQPTVEALVAAIESVVKMSEDERNKIGVEGRQFVLEKKNNIYQAKRICEFCGLDFYEK